MLLNFKYYFAGGPTSNRAWHPRSLGQGSYNTDLGNKPLQFKERPGELILQGNIELRQKLVGILEGALFIDAGNVWMLTDSDQPAKNFRFNQFYQEIAIGSGAGIRFDFNFFILRLDIGFKVYDPSRPLGERFFPHNMLKDFTINIGLGYPF